MLSGVGADGLCVRHEGGERRSAWDEVDRVVAANAVELVGDNVVLALALRDGCTLVVPETDAHWPALVDAVTVQLGTAISPTEWRLRLLAAPDEAVELYRRS